ncbi:MAG: hypothetical protein CVV63_04200, partial [Tenericutes bacterium HGW-Tenericutes-8]
MIILNLKKIRFGYLVTTNIESYPIEEDVIVMFMLHKGKELTPKQLKDILKENEKAVYTRKGLLYLKNMHSTHEFKVYLRGLGADDPTVEAITNDFKKRHYLDDQYYAKIMVDRYKLKYGKSKIKQLLSSKGIHKDIIDTLKIETDEDNLSLKLDKAISLNKKPNYHQAKNSLLRQFVSKGYDLQIVSRLLDDKLKHVLFDDSRSLQKDILKLFKKYDNLEVNQRLQKIKQALYQKGY